MSNTIKSPSTSGQDTCKRSILRQETHHYHSQLNHHPLLIGLTTENYSLTNYHKVLNAYFAIYQGLETRIELFTSKQDCSSSYVERIKLPWLAQDLAFFNASARIQESQFDIEELMPSIDNLGQLIGLLYVIEGSTLGGQHISKALLKYHGLTFDQGARFFHGYGERTLTFWNDFVAYLENVLEDDQQFLLAKQASCKTFELFQRTLDSSFS